LVWSKASTDTLGYAANPFVELALLFLNASLSTNSEIVFNIKEFQNNFVCI
jgi:hypothetical protein